MRTDELVACRTCNGEGWVCENHRDRAWEGGYTKCCGGAGSPCGSCNLEQAAAGYVDQAAAEIRRLSGLVEEAREALRPFARYADGVGQFIGPTDPMQMEFSSSVVGTRKIEEADFLKAAATLAKLEHKGEGE